MSGLHLKDVGRESTSQGCDRGRKRERGRMPGPRPEGRASGPRLWPEACQRHQRRRKGSCNSRGGVRVGSRRKGGAGPAAGGRRCTLVTLRGWRSAVKAVRERRVIPCGAAGADGPPITNDRDLREAGAPPHPRQEGAGPLVK